MTTRRFRLSRTASTVVGNVSSHMVDCLWRQVQVSILVETKRQGKDQGLTDLIRSQLLPNNDYEEKGTYFGIRDL